MRRSMLASISAVYSSSTSMRPAISAILAATAWIWALHLRSVVGVMAGAVGGTMGMGRTQIEAQRSSVTWTAAAACKW